jgi:alanyl-tRNA synthetase
MHSAEHLLTAVMRRRFDSPRNLEMHLGKSKTKCDYAVPRALTADDIQMIEETVNAEIKKDHPITAQVIPLEQAEDYDLWKVPKDTTKIRIVRIGNIDATPCNGDHVAHTREIGQLRVGSFTMKDEGIVRIRFTLEG